MMCIIIKCETIHSLGLGYKLVYDQAYLNKIKNSNLVDSASSHTLVSKIKPCMSKYKYILLWNCKWLIISVIIYLIVPYYLDTRSNSRANTCINTWLSGKVVFIRLKPTLLGGTLVIHDNHADCMAFLPAIHHSSFCPISFGW